ncbi:MAG: hypothetical protein HFF84_03020 [Oscillibacter sp.]|nr:hypothetical protein [Oscillibacter sp.]
MGLPEIFIAFETAAVSAITRSARGVLAVVLGGGAAAAEESKENVLSAARAYRSLAEVSKEDFSP